MASDETVRQLDTAAQALEVAVTTLANARDAYPDTEAHAVFDMVRRNIAANAAHVRALQIPARVYVDDKAVTA